jgi:thiol:disulfide interchange protein
MITRALKIVSILVLTILYASTTQAQTKEIVFFTGTLKEAQQLAKKQKKLIFMDAYTTWCGPCKMLKAQTFHNDLVADYYNANFINLAVDMEKGEGPMLSQTYAVRAYPTLLFINSKGEKVHQGMGFMQYDQFLSLGKEAKTIKPAKTTKPKKEKKAKK